MAEDTPNTAADAAAAELDKPMFLRWQDLPRNPRVQMGKLRAALVEQANHCRRYPEKMHHLDALLTEVLRWVRVYKGTHSEHLALAKARLAAEKAARQEAVAARQEAEKAEATQPDQETKKAAPAASQPASAAKAG